MTTTSQKENGKSEFNLEKILPIATLIVWSLAVLKQVLYYFLFDISIINYIDITEFLTLFLDNLIVFVIITLISWVIVLLKLQKGNAGEEKTDLTFAESLKANLRRHRYKYILSLPPTISLAYGVYHFDSFAASIIVLGAPIFFILSGSLIPVIANYFYGEQEIKIKFLVIGHILTLYISYILISTPFQKMSKKINSLNEVVKIELDSNLTIRSDSSSFIIGNTKNYLFYYDGKSKEKRIYPMNRVKAITYINSKDIIRSETVKKITTNDTLPKVKKDAARLDKK